MHKMKWLLIVGFVFQVITVRAQSDLKVQGASPGLYLTHTVAPRETWYAVGRLYNLPPKEIAEFNQTTMNSGLQIGQQLRIPLTMANFSQDGRRADDEVFVPVYYTVQPREWLYRISQNHNKVPVATLESWNNIKNDDLRVGMNLVVGYLKVKTGQSALASRGTKRIVATAPAVAKTETENTTTASNTGAYARNEEKAAEIAATTASTTASATPAATTPSTGTSAAVQPAVQRTPANQSETWSGHRGGYFKSSFRDKGKVTSGNAGVFRSTSGWKDGKYYALINDIPVGTIIKVTFSSTNKSIYAKVLGQLPEMKESIGLMLRLSDAAASELGADIGKFYVEVKW